MFLNIQSVNYLEFLFEMNQHIFNCETEKLLVM